MQTDACDAFDEVFTMYIVLMTNGANSTNPFIFEPICRGYADESVLRVKNVLLASPSQSS